MKTILTSCLILLVTSFSFCFAEEAKENIQCEGMLEVIKPGESLKLTTTGGESYYIWSKPVIKSLEAHVGKKIKVDGVTKPTKNGKLKHIVYLRKFEVVPKKEATPTEM